MAKLIEIATGRWPSPKNSRRDKITNYQHMRILAVSIAPLHPDRIIGGSQRILMEVVDALAESGHDVRVFSSRAKGSDWRFETPNGAIVETSLELRGAFPAPYQTAPHRLNSVWRRLAEGASWADRAYLHADAIYMRAALGDLPVIRSIHDFVYEEALLSAFTLPAARTIVPSQFLKDCIVASVGPVTDTSEIVVIPNGIAAGVRPVKPQPPDRLAPRSERDLILLHPHRLHREKGIEQSMLIAVEVQRRLPERKVRLLVPALQPDGSSDDAVLGGGSVLDIAASTGATEMLELHSWLGTVQMPGYYAAGDVTLCPGSFVEAFGLVPLESVVTGTPAVSTKVGAFREQVGIEGVRHFDYADVTAAATVVLESISEPFDSGLAAQQVAERYDAGRMRSGYVEAVTGTLASPGSESPGLHQGAAARWQFAPWCYLDGDRVYHDYQARFERFPELVAAFGGRHKVAEISLDKLPSGEFERAREDGFIVPAWSDSVHPT
jgi:glycosyltransferase involved in cell wall biosynthesis